LGSAGKLSVVARKTEYSPRRFQVLGFLKRARGIKTRAILSNYSRIQPPKIFPPNNETKPFTQYQKVNFIMQTKLLFLGGLMALLHFQSMPASAAPPTYRVYATREGLVDGITANGHRIVTNDRFVALPSATVLNPQGGYTYTVTIRNPANGKVASNVPVWDRGPWNLTDNYWHSPRVAKFASIPVGKPAAEVQAQNGTPAENGMVPNAPGAGIDVH